MYLFFVGNSFRKSGFPDDKRLKDECTFAHAVFTVTMAEMESNQLGGSISMLTRANRVKPIEYI